MSPPAGPAVADIRPGAALLPLGGCAHHQPADHVLGDGGVHGARHPAAVLRLRALRHRHRVQVGDRVKGWGGSHADWS